MFWNKKESLNIQNYFKLEADIQTLVKRVEIVEDRQDAIKTSLRSLRSQLNSYLGDDEEEEEKEKVRPKEKEDDGFGLFRI